MGWNWAISLARYCKVHVITEGEWRVQIEAALQELPQRENITFYYSPVSERVRAMCRNQGDWRFYLYYRRWQRRTLGIARRIMAENDIDIVHQLNMIGFREPGFLWKIADRPFVWGPIGGIGSFPAAYLRGAALKMRLFMLTKNFISALQLRFSPRVRKAVCRADVLLGAMSGVARHIGRREVVVMNETGSWPVVCLTEDQVGRFAGSGFDILWVGKFDFRKQLQLALKIIAQVRELAGLRFHIVGSGYKEQEAGYKRLAAEIGIEKLCLWHGQVEHGEALRLMQSSQLLLFTSLSEGTPAVVLEAVGNRLPVVCFDACGMGDVVDRRIGVKVPVRGPDDSVRRFAEAIRALHGDRERLQKMSDAATARAEELSWDNKARLMVDLYDEAAANFDKRCKRR